ncbi:DJ-1/PfpI family protein [Streptomyces triticiradicis]|uniref:DJ-1/PfpI family protein n=1 Tax=Streptomyces triticiradicis TaxID=2651189 RepID=A0A7J5D345_9ACTN|nr:DJ-1/PfpI family protein [Streptomyces triticiradicis]KAB1977754.1 DJ-1/PfpI family protein [Streptomyces triticiradicis]
MDIVIPLFRLFEPLDAVGPYELLANVPGARVRFVAPEPGRIADVLGSMRVDVPTRYTEVESCDVLLVPGGAGARLMLNDTEFIDWVRRIHETTRFTTSVCTGSLILGAAGLLKGLTATTHWLAKDDLETFGATYTAERVVRHDKIITSAGISSGIDMALGLCTLLSDELTARAVQLLTEYAPQPPYDSGSLATATPEVVARARELVSGG